MMRAKSDSIRRPAVARLALLLAGALLLLPGAALAQTGRFAAKPCAECHKKTLEQQSRKFVHAPFEKADGCESCHKRHGIVGSLALKEEEPKLCY